MLTTSITTKQRKVNATSFIAASAIVSVITVIFVLTSWKTKLSAIWIFAEIILKPSYIYGNARIIIRRIRSTSSVRHFFKPLIKSKP